MGQVKLGQVRSGQVRLKEERRVKVMLTTGRDKRRGRGVEKGGVAGWRGEGGRLKQMEKEGKEG